MSDRTKAIIIAELNDLFRKKPARYGRLTASSGINALGAWFLLRAIAAVGCYNAFVRPNGTCDLRDFGNFEIDGISLCWKITYRRHHPHEFGPPDASNPAQTIRQISLMFEEELCRPDHL